MAGIDDREELAKIDCERISYGEVLSESKTACTKDAESDKYFFHRSIVYTWFGISKLREVSFFLFALQSKYDFSLLSPSFYRRICCRIFDS